MWGWFRLGPSVEICVLCITLCANRGWNVCLMYWKQCVQSNESVATVMYSCFWLQFHLSVGYVGLIYFVAAVGYLLGALSSGILADKLVSWVYQLPQLPSFEITCWGVCKVEGLIVSLLNLCFDPAEDTKILDNDWSFNWFLWMSICQPTRLHHYTVNDTIHVIAWQLNYSTAVWR